MRYLTLFFLSMAAVAGAQDSAAGRRGVMAESTARRIALSAVSGGAVRSGRLDQAPGRSVYRFDIVTPATPGGTVVVVDASDGDVVSVGDATRNARAQRTRDDSLIRRESVLKDTTAMPPNTLHDTAAAHRDTTPMRKPHADP